MNDEKIQLKHPIIESDVSGKERQKKQLFDKRLDYFTFLSSSIISPNAFKEEEEKSSDDPKSQYEKTAEMKHHLSCHFVSVKEQTRLPLHIV